MRLLQPEEGGGLRRERAHGSGRDERPGVDLSRIQRQFDNVKDL